MNHNPDNYKLLLEQYLDGVLSPEEVTRVQTLLETDPALREEFQAMQQGIEAARYKGLHQYVAGLRRNMLEQKVSIHAKQKATSPLITLTRWTMRIAAGFILLAGAFGIYKYASVSPQSVYNKYYQDYELGRTRSTLQDPIDQAFHQQQWKEVIRLTAIAQLQNNKHLFLSGFAFLETGNNPKAIRQFVTLLAFNAKDGNDYFNDEAEYYLALGYIHNGEPGKAAPLLRKIKATPDHLYQDVIKKGSSLDLEVLSWKYSK